jgi:hypothetical protein
MGRGSKKFQGAYKNEHALIEEKVVPESLVELRKELPKHPDIFLLANRGKTFEECLAIIAAELNILVDGYYDVEDLCELLVKTLQCRHVRNSLSPHDPRLVPVDITEGFDKIEIKERLDPFTEMMRSYNCTQCDNRQACKAANRCLGDDSTAENLLKDQRVQ